MSRSRNAEDFRHKYLQIRFRYEDKYRGQIKRIRAIYEHGKAGIIPSYVDECLEAHFREYFVNAFLQALNWRLDVSADDGLPNLIPESPVLSVSRGTVRRLDYLGMERETQQPLLIVETKHPQSPLPRKKKPPDSQAFKHSTNDSWPSVIADGLRGQELIGEWNKWLKDLRDYVLDVQDKSQTIPKRVVITNGRWLILFTDPADSFLSSVPNPQKIFVFTYETAGGRPRDDFADGYNEIFEFLEHQQVLGETPPLTVGELRFYISAEKIVGAMHGLRLMYIEKPGLYAASPIIDVTPVVVLRSTHGVWLRVESGKEEPLPHNHEQLNDHLQKVQEDANQFLERINNVIGGVLKLSKLDAHYGNEEVFASLKGITKLKSEAHYDEYLIITGEYTHFLKPKPSVIGCPHHNWEYSHQNNCAEPRLVSIQRRSTDPRSFFITGEEHHCTHRDVSAAKASQITPYNREGSGLRSSSAFCEIWPFEKHLCCRTCIFEGICINTPVFKLPCKSDG